MKKTFRFLASALTVAALVCAVSVPALARNYAFGSIFANGGSKFNDPSSFLGGNALPALPTDGTGLKVSADSLIRDGDNFYDLAGSIKMPQGDMNSAVANGQMYQVLYAGADANTNVLFAYVPHGHVVSPGAPWHYDNNNHWKDCETCPCWVLMNWHHDIDNNGKCDQCGQDIVYRNVTVADSVGGKVKVSANKCVLGDRIAVTVEPDPGYKLVSLKGQNDNKNTYSIRPCFEDIKGSQYHFFVDVWNVEVQAVFEKA